MGNFIANAGQSLAGAADLLQAVIDQRLGQPWNFAGKVRVLQRLQWQSLRATKGSIMVRAVSSWTG